MTESGMVYFIGAGPGDPELITVKGQRLIAEADVIIYAGSLVPQALLQAAPTQAKCYNSADMNLEKQVSIMVQAVSSGRNVVRLHTGDPSIYGAIAEQMKALQEISVPYRVVPGVSSAMAAAAALKVALTLPQLTQTVIFTRLAGRTPVPEKERLADLAAHHSSLIIFLSTGMIDRVVKELLSAGYDPATPAAVVYRVSWPDEVIIRATLADIGQRLSEAEITHHALIVVSPALDPDLASNAPPSHLYGDALKPAKRDDRMAIVTLTRNGVATGKRLMAELPDSLLYAPKRFVAEEPSNESVRPTITSIRQTLQRAFQQHRALVCIMASGIVVREIAPLLRSKHVDPAVVVLDEAGQFAFSLLSGHKGGANALAKQCAEILGGQVVLTTASDTQGLPSLDLLAEQYGWYMAAAPDLAAMSGAMVNGETIGVYQDCGDESWLPQTKKDTFQVFESLEGLLESKVRYGVCISYQDLSVMFMRPGKELLELHPACLYVGIGCTRNTPAHEIEMAIVDTFSRLNLSLHSIAALATIDIKKDEQGLIELSNQRGWPLRTFTAKELAVVTDLPTPSEVAKKCVGVAGVAEPAALLAANANDWLVTKQKYTNVTVAVTLEKGETWVS